MPKKMHKLLTKAGKKYKAWRAAAPEREKAEIARLKRRQEIQRLRTGIAQQREKRMDMWRKRAETMPSPPSMFSGFGEPPKPVSTPARRKKRRKKSKVRKITASY
jgi:hypothetical protein